MGYTTVLLHYLFFLFFPDAMGKKYIDFMKWTRTRKKVFKSNVKNSLSS
jgi:hypothetical protein